MACERYGFAIGWLPATTNRAVALDRQGARKSAFRIVGRKLPRSRRAQEKTERNDKADDLGAKVGAKPKNNSSQPPVSDWLTDSRGGTRTHDPGIMSAVL